MEVRTFAGVERSFLSIGNIFRIEYVCQCITNVINKHHSNKKKAKREKITTILFSLQFQYGLAVLYERAVLTFACCKREWDLFVYTKASGLVDSLEIYWPTWD